MDTALDLDENKKYQSLPMLESSLYSYVLQLANDSSHLQLKDEEEGTESLMNSICKFLSACLLNYSWAVATMVLEDCCISASMLISTFHRLDLEPSQLMTMLALLLSNSLNENLNKMVLKYRVALLEMALRSSDDTNSFCMVLFKYLHKNENMVDDWDPLLVRDLTKRLMGNEDSMMPLIHMLLVSCIAQEVMLEETQILVKSVDALEKLNTKTNSHLMLLNNVCHKNKRGQRFLIEDLNLHRRLVHLSTKACAELIICGQDKKRNFMVLICDVLTLITTLVVNCSEAKSALAINVSMEKGKSSSLMQVLLDLINDVNLGDNLIRSRIWIPNSFRIITASLTSVECRSWIIRSSKFLNGKCIRDLDQLACDPGKAVEGLGKI